MGKSLCDTIEKKAQVKKPSTVQVTWKKFLKYVFWENNFLVKQLQNTNALGRGQQEGKKHVFLEELRMWAGEFGGFA